MLQKRNVLHTVIIFLGIAIQSPGKNISKEIFINAGELLTVDKIAIPYLAYNKSTAFSTTNEVINIGVGDTLLLTITNNDVNPHGFAIKNYSISNKIIGLQSSITVKIYSPKEKVLVFYDPLNYPNNRYMGLGGMICIKNNLNHKYFYWNLKEHEVAYSKKIAVQQGVDWLKYYPDYFTINGLSHPDLQKDTTARVVGKVGDTILIAIANTGQSKHAIHFHGFHLRVIYSSTDQIDVDSSKDSFPLESMQSLILEMVPDKTGTYSVHDHNLVAISGGGVHPNGMFLMMQID